MPHEFVRPLIWETSDVCSQVSIGGRHAWGPSPAAARSGEPSHRVRADRVGLRATPLEVRARGSQVPLAVGSRPASSGVGETTGPPPLRPSRLSSGALAPPEERVEEPSHRPRRWAPGLLAKAYAHAELPRARELSSKATYRAARLVILGWLHPLGSPDQQRRGARSYSSPSDKWPRGRDGESGPFHPSAIIVFLPQEEGNRGRRTD